MEILTKIKTPANLCDLDAIEDLMQEEEFLEIYDKHIHARNVNYIFQDCGGLVKVIIC